MSSPTALNHHPQMLNTSRRVPDGSPIARSGRSIRLAALRVPLAAKLVGANAIVVAGLLGGWLIAGGTMTATVAATVAVFVALHLALVLVALRPIRDLEAVALRVWQGDIRARVDLSNVADDQVVRVGAMFNTLLAGLEADGARMRELTSQIIAAADRERVALAHELHESMAQQIAALLLQISAVARDAEDPLLAQRLVAARNAAEKILEQVRALSQSVHSAVLDDLGLSSALRKLARDASSGNGVDIDVDALEDRTRLPANVEATLYSVASEAVRNATRHAAPTRVRITLRAHESEAVLQVHDDGRGFDAAAVERQSSGVGLASIRHRLDLVDGRLHINTAVGHGTTVAATIPLGAGFNRVRGERS